MAERSRIHLEVEGLVQGVGFRPTVHRLTTQLALSGFIRNTPQGAELELEGQPDQVAQFVPLLQQQAPVLARIRRVSTVSIPPTGETGFHILPSVGQHAPDTQVSPDVGICPDCLREMRDPKDRRYRHPFLNCTNCGPRFTIIQSVPYDRERTAMGAFPMCEDCQGEYTDITDRRYHAQPTCCLNCGPTLTYLDGTGTAVEGDPIRLAQAHLREGDIVAVKGLGGFHLACLPEYASLLRTRKEREGKPLALMCADLDAARTLCYISRSEEEALTSWRRPIVLLKKHDPAPDVLSHTPELGLMLPYTPLHYLLMEGFSALVMTSANPSDCPVFIGNREAVEGLQGIADGFLLHNRDIVTRCDDSLVRIFRGEEYPLRRSRGYVPQPVEVPVPVQGLLGCGAEQKAGFALGKGKDALLSQHIGDLKNMETLEHYETQLHHFRTLFGVEVEGLACDLHPDYLSTQVAQQLAREWSVPLLPVQHHHAHMLSCMADNRLEGPCIGLVWDGTGLGTDGTIWGAECLAGDALSFTRLGSIFPISLPGGDACARDAGRIAHSLRYAAGLETNPQDMLTLQLRAGLNCPPASSMGRLFDGVYALLGGSSPVHYEGESAIRLEHMAQAGVTQALPVEMETVDGVCRLQTPALTVALLEGLQQGQSPHLLAAQFMNAMVELAVRQCQFARAQTGLDRVVLSGGVFQNMYLLPRILDALAAQGFEAYHHSRVSTNDEGIALGQLMAAAARRKEG
ncbi:carbamoyltransferase HypF [Pseudoflavonifractor sp. An85]|uniref:carbamoyltransferase HypF n=1 Tax=Pseudoflavonifractor sp. An85 TaxID=1965661 RepID=UPI000B37BDF7|nr:carbamoyltransferase HypF [Pseudoflavonifractor sp. An85]OUN24895.1 carbamoyltransferase HypF [Pseudoflavonifractor sp. An85]